MAQFTAAQKNHEVLATHMGEYNISEDMITWVWLGQEAAHTW